VGAGPDTEVIVQDKRIPERTATVRCPVSQATAWLCLHVTMPQGCGVRVQDTSLSTREGDTHQREKSRAVI
jgi:hypothetical protein